MAGLLGAGSLSLSSRLVASDAVAAELRLWAQTRFAWGKSDCLISIVRYVCRVLDKPMPEWPRYSTGAGALRILERHGGLERYAAGVLGTLDCTVTRWPMRGDVGLIDIPGTGPTMSLCLGEKWAARAQHGAMIMGLQPEMAWAVGLERRAAEAKQNWSATCQWR